MNLEPHIKIGEPGQSITLYEGQLEILLGEKSDSIHNGEIIFVFLPKPRLEFHLTDSDSLVIKLLFDRINDFKIKFPNHNFLVDVTAISKSTQNSKVIAVQLQKIKREISNAIYKLKAYIPNFLEILSPINLNTDAYQISIRLISNSTEIYKYLRYSNNYAITHICDVKRHNNDSFNVEEANYLIKCIYYFLSFVRGLWIAPILIYGFDMNNDLVWESLENNVDNWQFTTSWLPQIESTNIESAFSGFWNKWHDDRWKEVIELSIYWYVAVSKQSGGQEGSIILAQAALEMLANVVLVEDRKIVSIDGFGKLTAKDQISLLLNQCSIPLEVPSTLNRLNKYAKENNWSNGSQAITELRNKLIHPQLKNRKKFLNLPSGVVSET
ncbi:MAG: hypothetical protein AAGF83_26295 [Cyanobacteria bacterium P01_G01_bin.67]